MNILAIETSCDETCAAVVCDGQIKSNIVSSQIDLHKEWGGVVPSIAKRAHEEKIQTVIDTALEKAQITLDEIDAVAVTRGPGLAIALEVGLLHAKEIAIKHNKKFIAVNHIEGHVLSSLTPETKFPAVALIISGGHTELIYIDEIGKYKIFAQTIDDALGESLDKAARMLGLGYPGGAELEKRASLGNSQVYPLPLPMQGRENLNQFSYSGLKSAMWRLTEKLKANDTKLSETQINDLAASFQSVAFKHLQKVVAASIENSGYNVQNLLVGGGVAANKTLRNQLEKMASNSGIMALFPPKDLYGDNAAMIGIAANFKAQRNEFSPPNTVDRLPRWRIDQ